MEFGFNFHFFSRDFAILTLSKICNPQKFSVKTSQLLFVVSSFRQILCIHSRNGFLWFPETSDNLNFPQKDCLGTGTLAIFQYDFYCYHQPLISSATAHHLFIFLLIIFSSSVNHPLIISHYPFKDDQLFSFSAYCFLDGSKSASSFFFSFVC